MPALALNTAVNAPRNAPASRDGGELQISKLSSGLRTLYGIAGRIGSMRAQRLVLRLILRLEGGEFFSATTRQLMSRHHDIAVGAYSYGCFDPVRFDGGLIVGRYSSISRSAASYRRNHPADHFSTHPLLYRSSDRAGASNRNPLRIGNDVWIGAHALILPGCRQIGDGAVIGAGSVVTRDVAPYQVVAGNPARPVRDRFDVTTAERLQRSGWWNRSPEQLVGDSVPTAKPQRDGGSE